MKIFFLHPHSPGRIEEVDEAYETTVDCTEIEK